MRLLLNPKSAEWLKFPHADAKFLIRPISPAKYDKIRRDSLIKGTKELDVAKWGENFAHAAIEDWSGIDEAGQPAECNETNVRTFGRHQAVNIMTWVIDEATSLDRFRQDEEDAAKKD